MLCERVQRAPSIRRLVLLGGRSNDFQILRKYVEDRWIKSLHVEDMPIDDKVIVRTRARMRPCHEVLGHRGQPVCASSERALHPRGLAHTR